MGVFEGKRPLVRNKRRWKDNILLVLKKYGGDNTIWTSYSGSGLVVGSFRTEIKVMVPKKIKLGEFLH